MKKILIILVIFLVSTNSLFAQNLNRANKLFQKRSYIEAAELYEKETVKTQEIYEKLGDCYYFNNEMKNAAFYYKTLLNNNASTVNPNYYFKYAETLKGTNNFEEADIWLQKYYEAKKLTPSQTVETLQFFKNLNATIKRPYELHKVTANTEGSDFGTAFYNNGIVFSSTRNEGPLYAWNNQPYLDLFQAEITENGDLVNVTPFSKEINTKMHESNAVFTKNGKTMYFTRNNFIDGKKGKDDQKVSNLKIYQAELVDGNWTNIKALPFCSDNYSVEHPALSPNEKQLYFASDMPGTIGSFDLFVVEKDENGQFGTPKNLGPTINTELREQFPFVSSNNTLYFASNGHFGMGGLDIFKSQILENNFSKPVNLSNVINSNSDDFAFIIDEDRELGYFSSNRADGLGNDDIYYFTQVQLFYVQGVVQNKNTLAPLPGTEVTLLNQKNDIIAKTIADNNGNYSFKIDRANSYKLKATQKAYMPFEIDFVTNNKGDINQNIPISMELFQDVEEKIVVENNKVQIKIEPIYFEFNRWNITKSAALELDNVVEIMKKYPTMAIEIGAHTDFRGEESYNLMLSEKRANSVREYLVSQGVANENVKSVGYGETQPINACVKPGICTKKQYSLNRRCEFVIIN
ncbi:hypothetical protein EC396_13910 [Lutibacter sp. HS1-25]|uniref:OmpA family protein n=1 Tax=Lutibacter sp. HS1-25 TaxID=2485000 RepID=UPI0010108D89|nr:OmpA family protein [Lutibacter sp. HS1-25]RXP46613.1 hypothetical protein EC396_13910 [Lutibacter sp. HS1-25]